MITWTRHANNYQMQRQSGFPFAVWISGERVSGQMTYTVSIYAGEKRIGGSQSKEFEQAEQYVVRWFEDLQVQIKSLLETHDTAQPSDPFGQLPL